MLWNTQTASPRICDRLTQTWKSSQIQNASFYSNSVKPTKHMCYPMVGIFSKTWLTLSKHGNTHGKCSKSKIQNICGQFSVLLHKYLGGISLQIVGYRFLHESNHPIWIPLPFTFSWMSLAEFGWTVLPAHSQNSQKWDIKNHKYQ